MNVLNAAGLHGELGVDAYDVVDILGLFEYLAEQDSVFRYQKVVNSRERRFAGAITFLRNAYALVRPGGVLILGNMLDSHPGLSVTLDVVQWPHLKPRSPAQVRSIVDQAGIPTARMRGFQAQDGVYGVYAISKPSKA